MRAYQIPLLVIMGLLCQQTLASEPERFIVVNAQGYIESVPDTLKLTVSAKQTRETLAEARRAVDNMVAQATKIASSHGVAEDDIDSSHLNAWPEYEWRKQERHYLGESVQRNLVLTIRDLNQYAGLIEQLSKLKLAGIAPPQPSHSNIAQLRLDALKAAIAQGRKKALVIAAEIDADLGPVLRVEEGGGVPIQPRVAFSEARAASDSGGGHGFSLSKQRVNAAVIVRYSLK